MGNSTKRRSGSIRKQPNGRYLARIQRGVKADGRPRVVTKTFDTESDADAWLTAQSVELAERPDLVAGITLRAVWKAYVSDREGKLAKKTMAFYRWYMDGGPKRGKCKSSHVTWLDVLGDADISTITPQMVQHHISTMASAKGRHAKATISAVLTWAARAGMIESNPLRGHKFEYSKKVREVSFDEDPFAAIEGVRDVWSQDECLKCFEHIRGLPLESAWLACVGAGLRVEEALALRGMDVRRIRVKDMKDPRKSYMVTQLAVHAARTDMDERKETKTRQSVRIVAMVEPFGERYWEIAKDVPRNELVCPVSASNQNKRWRGYFAEPSKSKHAPRKEGCNNLGRLRLKGLRYIPLSKMRNTHVTLCQMAGMSDSMNAFVHGHSEMVERRNYMRPDIAAVTSGEEYLRLVM